MYALKAIFYIICIFFSIFQSKDLDNTVKEYIKSTFLKKILKRIIILSIFIDILMIITVIITTILIYFNINIDRIVINLPPSVVILQFAFLSIIESLIRLRDLRRQGKDYWEIIIEIIFSRDPSIYYGANFLVVIIFFLLILLLYLIVNLICELVIWIKF